MGWVGILRNRSQGIVSIDFLVVPTVRFKILHVFLFLSIERRRIIHFGVTQQPSAAWATQQVVEAFPWETTPKYLLRDRDAIYGDWSRRRVTNVGIEEVLMAPRSPWQNAFAESFVETLKREALNYFMCFCLDQLDYILKTWGRHYNTERPHGGIGMNNEVLKKMFKPQPHGTVRCRQQLGGIINSYYREAA